MGNNLKILIIGLGSIGQKHLSYLKQIDNLNIAALRTGKGTLNGVSQLTEFYSIKDAVNYNPDGVIIANPTSLHVDYALPFLEAGCKVLIEKPISDDVISAAQLEKYYNQIRVAYPLRFTALSKFLKAKFQQEPPFKISFKRSYFLPKWHPYADYKTEYTARKELGGGVIRTLSHEIDLAIHWLGKPKSVQGFTDKISFLEMDTDDFAFFSFKMDNRARVNFELDLFSPANINIGEAFTQKGKYEWNMEAIFFTPYSETKATQLDISLTNSVDTMYREQIADFIGFINHQESSCTTFEVAITVLAIIQQIDEKKQ